MAVSHDQFTIQITRLKETFGEKVFSEQRKLMIWNALQELEYQELISIVDSFIRSAKHPPLPIDFIEAAKGYYRGKKKLALGEFAPKAQAKCFDCGDSGFIRLVRRDQFQPWAKWHRGSAPCHCDRGFKAIIAAGKMKPSTNLGPQFRDDWCNSYEVYPAYRSGSEELYPKEER